MHISEQGIALITQFEGFSSIPYICPAGKGTIGYGHVIVAGEQFPSKGISKDMAITILKQDVVLCEQAIDRLVVVELAQNQFDALVSFIYNIGVKAFEKSTLLVFLNDAQYEKAVNELGKWVFAGGKRLDGLAQRRLAEKNLFIHAIFTKL